MLVIDDLDEATVEQAGALVAREQAATRQTDHRAGDRRAASGRQDQDLEPERSTSTDTVPWAVTRQVRGAGSSPVILADPVGAPE